MSGEYYLGTTAWAATSMNLPRPALMAMGWIHIPAIYREMVVADIGCGTGVWALDAVDLAPRLVKAEGLDINILEVPPKAWLPSNASFQEFDLMKDLPDQYVELYDIVNVQFASSFVRDNVVAETMAKLVRMLKPRGWLQITDTFYHDWTWMTATGSQAPKTLKLYDLVGQIFGGYDQWTWMRDMEQTLQDAGLENVHATRPKSKPSTRQPNMMNWMLAMSEAGMALSKHPTLGHHSSALLELKDDATKEVRELGVGMELALVRGVGRKPSP